MAQKKHKPEEIVAKLRQVDVLLSQGRPVAEAIRTIGVTAFTYYRWRKEFGGLKSDQVKRLKDLEKENERLRKAVSDLTLEKLILAEAARETSSLFGVHRSTPFARVLDRSVYSPAEFLLLSEVGLCRLMMGSEGVGGAI